MAKVPDPSQAEFRIPSGISSVGRKPSSFEGQAALRASDSAIGEDPNTTCVFKNVHWKPEGAAHNQPVTFCFDLKNDYSSKYLLKRKLIAIYQKNLMGDIILFSVEILRIVKQLVLDV